MASVEEIIADFVKGAERAGGRVQLHDEGQLGQFAPQAGASLGPEPKLASIPGVLGGGLLGGLGGLLGGSLAGAGTGALLSKLTGLNPIQAKDLVGVLSNVGGGLGGLGGVFTGGEAGRDAPPDPSLLQRLKGAALQRAHEDGAKAAATHFKVAFAPLVAAGLSALAPVAARGLVGRVAPAAARTLAKPISGALFDAGTQMAAQKALS